MQSISSGLIGPRVAYTESLMKGRTYEVLPPCGGVRHVGSIALSMMEMFLGYPAAVSLGLAKRTSSPWYLVSQKPHVKV